MNGISNLSKHRQSTSKAGGRLGELTRFHVARKVAGCGWVVIHDPKYVTIRIDSIPWRAIGGPRAWKRHGGIHRFDQSPILRQLVELGPPPFRFLRAPSCWPVHSRPTPDPARVEYQSPGYRAAAPWETERIPMSTPKGLHTETCDPSVATANRPTGPSRTTVQFVT